MKTRGRGRGVNVGWKDYVDQRFEDNAKLYDERSRVSEIESRAVELRIDLLQRTQDQAEGRRTALTVIVSAGISVVTGVVVGLIVFFLAHH